MKSAEIFCNVIGSTGKYHQIDQYECNVPFTPMRNSLKGLNALNAKDSSWKCVLIMVLDLHNGSLELRSNTLPSN